MNPREKIQHEHESAVIDEFLSCYNEQQQSQYVVTEKPEPPDAIARDGNNFIWIEHADIHRSFEEAKAERSSVTPGETPYKRKEYLIVDPDKKTAIAFVSTLSKKLSKKSYRDVAKKYGPGILILTERDPLFDESTLECIRQYVKTYNFENDKGYFRVVYCGIRGSISGFAFEEISYKNSEQIAQDRP